VFGFEGSAVSVDDQLDYVIDEMRILIYGGLVVDALRDNEMQIAVFGVAENDGVVVIVLAEKPGEVERAVGQPLDGERYVFDDDRGSGLTQ
jgi:hypothetical protein